MVSEEHWHGLTCNNCFNQDTVLPRVAGNHFEEVAMTAHQGTTTLPKTNSSPLRISMASQKGNFIFQPLGRCNKILNPLIGLG